MNEDADHPYLASYEHLVHGTSLADTETIVGLAEEVYAEAAHLWNRYSANLHE